MVSIPPLTLPSKVPKLLACSSVLWQVVKNGLLSVVCVLVAMMSQHLVMLLWLLLGIATMNASTFLIAKLPVPVVMTGSFTAVVQPVCFGVKNIMVGVFCVG